VDVNHVKEELIQIKLSDNVIKYFVVSDKELYKKMMLLIVLIVVLALELKNQILYAELILVTYQKNNSHVMMEFVNNAQLTRLWMQLKLNAFIQHVQLTKW